MSTVGLFLTSAFRESLFGVKDFHSEPRDGIEASQLEENSVAGFSELRPFHDELWQRPVFTHGDLSSSNLMVHNDEVVGILDWATVRWMLPCWEYPSAWYVAPMNQFWQDEVGKFLTPMPRELEMEAISRRWFAAISDTYRTSRPKFHGVTIHTIL